MVHRWGLQLILIRVVCVRLLLVAAPALVGFWRADVVPHKHVANCDEALDARSWLMEAPMVCCAPSCGVSPAAMVNNGWMRTGLLGNARRT